MSSFWSNVQNGTFYIVGWGAHGVDQVNISVQFRLSVEEREASCLLDKRLIRLGLSHHNYTFAQTPGRSKIGRIMKLAVSRHQSESAAIDDSLPPIFFGPSIIGSHRQWDADSVRDQFPTVHWKTLSPHQMGILPLHNALVCNSPW